MKIASEFREFIERGNVMDMAVGIIIGAAFTAIVTSLVDNIITSLTSDIINPFIKLITGGNGTEVAGLTIPVAGTENGIDFGAFIGAVINFLIIAFIVFLMVKAMNKLRDKGAKVLGKNGEELQEKAPTCPYCRSEIAEDATRCPHCAAELPAPAVPTVVAAEG